MTTTSPGSLHFFYRLPMYSEAKLAFIIYLWYPKTMVRPVLPMHACQYVLN